MSVTQAQYFFTVYVNVKISKERRAQSYGNHSKSFLVFFQCIQLGNPNPLSRSWKLACFNTFPHAPSSVILVSNVTPRGSGLHHMEEGPFYPDKMRLFSDSKESACNAGDPGSIPGSGWSPGEGNGNHSSILTWRIPWVEEPGRLQSMGLQIVGTRLSN